ncbi:MAG TPA: aminotransferase class III-fold pyridoxal phosphate-dependent enzyme [Gemmatimonadales bacterium]|nr:aminotransferase class III-fold pyridoxal phosphate-dependent enzyme [Gemmatimonadales bacterium]
MKDDPVAGFTSTGSKRPDALFGAADDGWNPPARMVRAQGCRVWDARGREFVDFVMGLGAVALGYGHPEVGRAAIEAIGHGVVGPLAPVLEEELATDLRRLMPWIEQVRFLKSGAEACAAAVRLARVATGREMVLGCGYHGWLDWCEGSAGVPTSTRALFGELPFDDVDGTRRLLAEAGDRLACVIVEPVVVREPTAAWLEVLRTETERHGALMIVDEIKTACRLAIGGGTERYALRPDLVVLGKAIANGFPLAAVGGRRDVMAEVNRTWISSTLATESVSLAAARATLAVVQRDGIPGRLGTLGGRLLAGLGTLAQRHPERIAGVAGVPEMCFLQFWDEGASKALARGAADRGVLFKRSAYNFVSAAHDAAVIDRALDVLGEVFASPTR